jgi:hypothetical protein
MSRLQIIGANELHYNPFWFRTAIIESPEELTLQDLPEVNLCDFETLNLKMENQ